MSGNPTLLRDVFRPPIARDPICATPGEGFGVGGGGEALWKGGQVPADDGQL